MSMAGCTSPAELPDAPVMRRRVATWLMVGLPWLLPLHGPIGSRLAAQSTEFFQRVTVVDAQEQVVAVITDELRLLSFAAHWAVRTPERRPIAARGTRAASSAAGRAGAQRAPEPSYRLDLVSTAGGSRWRYRPSGRLESLDGEPQVWELADPDEMNRLLGLPTR